MSTSGNLSWAETEAMRRARVMNDAYTIYEHKRNPDYIVRCWAASAPDPNNWRRRATVQPDGSCSFGALS